MCVHGATYAAIYTIFGIRNDHTGLYHGGGHSTAVRENTCSTRNMHQEVTARQPTCAGNIFEIVIYIDLTKRYEDRRVAFKSDSDAILFTRRIELKYLARACVVANGILARQRPQAASVQVGPSGTWREAPAKKTHQL